MHQFKTLRNNALILSFILVTLGCASGKNQISTVGTGLRVEAVPAGMEIGLTADAVPEGICLTFDNIPMETKRLFIHFQFFSDHEELTEIIGPVSSYADLRDSSLAQVKQTRKVVFPTVREGCKYHISAIFQNENFEDITDWIYADCTADKGIFLSNYVTLDLNETYSDVTLSSEPVFSSEVTYDDIKYDFSVTILYYRTETERGSIGVASHHISGIEGLTWVFDPEMTNKLREGGYLESGSYPAYVTARCNIIYDNIKWSVEIAKTPEFTYSL